MPTSPSPDPSESRLVAQAIAGDRDAFGDLYERHVDAIYRYIFYRVGDAGGAEDLTQTVFLKAWEALDRYQPRGIRFTSWLYTIAHNVLVDCHRTRKTTDPLDDDFCRPSRARKPEDQVSEREQSTILADALARLESLHQEVLTLRFINGLSHAETAKIMGRSEGALRVLQYRALAALRLFLARKLKNHD